MRIPHADPTCGSNMRIQHVDPTFGSYTCSGPTFASHIWMIVPPTFNTHIRIPRLDPVLAGGSSGFGPPRAPPAYAPSFNEAGVRKLPKPNRNRTETEPKTNRKQTTNKPQTNHTVSYVPSLLYLFIHLSLSVRCGTCVSHACRVRVTCRSC